MPLLSNEKIIGLDISDSELRLILLRKNRKKITIISANRTALSPETIVDGEIKKPEEFKNAVQKLLKTSKGSRIETDRVITALPESKTFIKILHVTIKTDEKMEDALNHQIPNNIPVEIHNIYYDWQIINSSRNKDSVDYTVLVGVAPKTLSDSYSKIFQNMHLVPIAFEIEAAPISRCLLDDDSESGKIIIDFGASRSSLILYDKGTVQLSISLPISGNGISQLISEKLKIHYEDAEKAKIICGLDEEKCKGGLKKVMISALDDLSEKIRDAIAFYENNFSDTNKIEKILLTGGGANLLNIEKIIAEQIHLPVEVANPLKKIYKVHKDIQINKNTMQSYTTAIGLALRGLTEKL